MEKQEKIITRMNILGGMNALVLECGDEELYNLWFECVPDGATEEDLKEIAEDDDLYCFTISMYRFIEKEIYFNR